MRSRKPTLINDAYLHRRNIALLLVLVTVFLAFSVESVEEDEGHFKHSEWVQHFQASQLNRRLVNVGPLLLIKVRSAKKQLPSQTVRFRGNGPGASGGRFALVDALRYAGGGAICIC